MSKTSSGKRLIIKEIWECTSIYEIVKYGKVLEVLRNFWEKYWFYHILPTENFNQKFPMKNVPIGNSDFYGG